MMVTEVGHFFHPVAAPEGGGNGAAGALPPGDPLGPCPACGLDLLLCTPPDGAVRFVACSGTHARWPVHP